MKHNEYQEHHQNKKPKRTENKNEITEKIELETLEVIGNSENNVQQTSEDWDKEIQEYREQIERENAAQEPGPTEQANRNQGRKLSRVPGREQ